MHETNNSIANTLELCLSCTNQSILTKGTDALFPVLQELTNIITITSTQVMVYHWWIPCETLVHTGSR